MTDRAVPPSIELIETLNRLCTLACNHDPFASVIGPFPHDSSLREVVRQWQESCTLVRELLRQGAANPRGREWAMALHVALQAAERLAPVMRAGLDDPRIRINASEMRKLGTDFGNARDELHAALSVPELDNKDQSDFQPARAFPKNMASKLRAATGKNRKTSKVRSKMIDGTKCYSRSDARRLWPDDFKGM
jgi:hypothetical protein